MIYFVLFEVHKNCQISNYIYHCDAKNAATAKEKAKEAWKTNGNKPHQFHIYGKKSNIQDEKYLRVKTWSGREINGHDVMENFICTDFRTWRINGKNLYGV